MCFASLKNASLCVKISCGRRAGRGRVLAANLRTFYAKILKYSCRAHYGTFRRRLHIKCRYTYCVSKQSASVRVQIVPSNTHATPMGLKSNNHKTTFSSQALTVEISLNQENTCLQPTLCQGLTHVYLWDLSPGAGASLELRTLTLCPDTHICTMGWGALIVDQVTHLQHNNCYTERVIGWRL